MVWDEPEEPWVNAALWVNGTLQWDRHPPTMFEPLVAESLAGDIFFCTDLTVPQPRVVVSPSDGTYRRWSGPAVNRALRERYAMRAVLAVRCAGEGWEGRLFFLDKPRMTGDDVPLGKVVAHQVTADIDHLYLQQRLRQAAVMEERVRFARDLHDGLLQSLTGTALQLQTVRRLLNEGQTAALARLDEIQHLITAEQANLRSYIRELKPAAMLARRVSQSLKTTLRTLVDRIERQWGLQVELTTGELTEADAAAVAHHIAHLVHEALVNAARHGGASGATVTVREVSDHVTITVADNGRGFPFRGRYGMTALNDMGAGPASLKERTAALRGTLTVESGSGGACVEITLPLAPVRV
jgi:signal transduction histidine kinase